MNFLNTKSLYMSHYENLIYQIIATTIKTRCWCSIIFLFLIFKQTIVQYIFKLRVEHSQL